MAETALATERAWVIYALSDPESEEVRYVGWTINLRTRIRDHLKPSRLSMGTWRDKWLQKLVSKGLRPTVSVLEDGHGEGHAESERKWIAHYRAIGRLTNLTDGGEGAPGRTHSDDAKHRMSEKRIGVSPSPKAIAATIALNTGVPHSPERIARRMEFVRGVAKSAEHRARLSIAHKGRKHTAESKAKMSLKRAGVPQGPHSPETIAKISAANKGRLNHAKRIWWATRTPEQIAAMIEKRRQTCEARKAKDRDAKTT